MIDVVTHEIGGITFKTEANTSLSPLRRGGFSQFISANEKIDVYQYLHKIELEGNALDSAPNLDPLIYREPLRSKLSAILERGEKFEIVTDTTQAVIRNFSQCVFELFYYGGLQRGYDPEVKLDIPSIALGPALRSIFSNFMPVFSAAIVHSSAVLRNNLAAVFLAPSTGGKTTVTETVNDDLILNDDQNILRREENNGFMVYGTPFGKVANAIGAKLGGFFLLEKARHFELMPVKPANVLEHLWADQLLYAFYLPLSLRIQLNEILYIACHKNPCYLMRFPRDYVDWNAIDTAMRA